MFKALLLVLLLAGPAQAWEGYVDGAVGASIFSCTICRDDGTWIQTGLPNRKYLQSLTFKTGAGFWADNGWGLSGAYLNMTTGPWIDAQVVSDNDYDPHAHKCLANCSNTIRFVTTDRMQGWEIAVARRWKVGDVWLYPRLGLAQVFHHIHVTVGPSSGDLHGNFFAPLGGAGIQWRWLFAEASYYFGIGGNTDLSAGYPISKQFAIGVGGLRWTF